MPKSTLWKIKGQRRLNRRHNTADFMWSLDELRSCSYSLSCFPQRFFWHVVRTTGKGNLQEAVAAKAIILNSPQIRWVSSKNNLSWWLMHRFQPWNVAETYWCDFFFFNNEKDVKSKFEPIHSRGNTFCRMIYLTLFKYMIN